ncbi:MAG: hypothetical protein ABI867_31185 [Kofleriaceae bacterium]
MLRWSAVLAGSAVAVGTWLVLQLFGSGVAMKALDADNVDSIHNVGIGTTVWSVIALLIAMVAGGWLAARLCAHRDRRVAGLHGVLVWAVTSLVGFVAISSAVALATQNSHATAVTAPEPGTHAMVARTLESINARLRIEAKPELTMEDLIVSSRKAVTLDGVDGSLFAAALDERSTLTRLETDQIVRQLGDRAPDLIVATNRIGEHRAAAINLAESTGTMLLVAAFAIALGLLAAVGGALLAARGLLQRYGYTNEPHTTAPYPIPPTPPVDPVDDLTVR